MERVIHKKYLLYCQTDVLEAVNTSIQCMVGALPGLRYWCSAEHITPAGTNVTYVFLCFYFPTDFKILKERICPFVFHTSSAESKPSRLIRKYIKESGFSWHLGKSRPIPGTFIEKEGGL